MAKGKFKSERQRRWMWANAPKAARKWAHNLKTGKSDWAGKTVRSKGRGRGIGGRRGRK